MKTLPTTGRTGKALALALTLILASGCDFTADNPGPVQDDFVSSEDGFSGAVNGAGRGLAEALNWVAYTSAAVSRELSPSGSIGSYGISVLHRQGQLEPNDTNTHYDFAQRARWVAENTTNILREGLEDFSSSELAARALLFSAYSNRMIGENWCCTVIDGGAAEPHTAALQRALDQFNEAFTVATAAGNTDLALAAQGGRASVKMWLGDWAGATADAQAVIDAGGEDFAHVMPYFDNDQDQGNRIYWAGSNASQYRAHTTYHTVMEAYYTETNDPRAAWVTNEELPFGDAQVDNESIPWYFAQKHAEPTSPIRLTSGQEMLLILAEDALVNGQDAAAAVGFINRVRALAGVDPVEAATLDEAWTMLKRERYIELWLEARRLGDRRRWDGPDGNLAATPGTYQFYELNNWRDEAYTFHRSFPIPLSELDTNPNVTSARPF